MARDRVAQSPGELEPRVPGHPLAPIRGPSSSSAALEGGLESGSNGLVSSEDGARSNSRAQVSKSLRRAGLA